VGFRSAAILGSPVGENSEYRNVELVEEWYDPVVEKIGGCDRGFGRVELAHGDLGIGIDKSSSKLAEAVSGVTSIAGEIEDISKYEVLDLSEFVLKTTRGIVETLVQARAA
jgi:hypothetical protein